eukprot:TRINITY_DN13930_c0_g1_i1.p2 TRINITY_DN13930_c0_g1~~TRINITY_DN13930_c0_g1_i1.p2  ORF type:complete len:104 (+),score=25.05 TRINITY_DN13930_c0_g1_i1:1315-1626(+)
MEPSREKMAANLCISDTDLRAWVNKVYQTGTAAALEPPIKKQKLGGVHLTPEEELQQEFEDWFQEIAGSGSADWDLDEAQDEFNSLVNVRRSSRSVSRDCQNV